MAREFRKTQAASEIFDAAAADSLARLGFALGSLSRELRTHPLLSAWEFRAMVQGARSAAALAGLAVDRGRLLAAAANLSVSIHRHDAGLPFALRHIRIQADWFQAARTARGNIPWLLSEHRPVEPACAGPWARRWFAWAGQDIAACIEALAAAPDGLPGLLAGVRAWSAGGGDPMALTVALPVVVYALGLSPTPLPGLVGRAVAAAPRGRWIQALADEMAGNVADLQRLIQGLERARLGIAGAVAAATASSRLPAVAELALSRPAIAAPLIVRHLTRLARRGATLGRTSPLTLSARGTAISAAGAGHMLRDLARSGWLVEMTGSRTCKAYVLRDLADLGIDVVPARKRSPRRLSAAPEAVEIPPLPAPADRVVPVEVDFTDILSDLRMVEGRIASLLEERGLQRHPLKPTTRDHGEDDDGSGAVS